MAFNRGNPATNSLLVSAEIRANWDAIQASIGAVNWLQDPLFECWHVDDVTIPGTWSLSGAGALVARDTTPTRIEYGTMGPRVTFGAAPAVVFQDAIDAPTFLQHFDGKVFSAGIFVNADTIGIAELRIDDGVTNTPSTPNLAANPGAPEYLEVEHVVNPAATRIRIEARVNAGGSATWSAASALFADMRPAVGRFVHPVTLPVSLSATRPGSAAVSVLAARKRLHRPFIATHGTVDVTGVPAGGSDVYNFLKPDGAGGTVDVFNPGITLPAGAAGAAFAVFTTHNARCFVPDLSASYASPIPAGVRIAAEIQSIAPTPGANVSLELFGIAWARQQELIIQGLNGLK